MTTTKVQTYVVRQTVVENYEEIYHVAAATEEEAVERLKWGKPYIDPQTGKLGAFCRVEARADGYDDENKEVTRRYVAGTEQVVDGTVQS
jgi:hypothetical protein